MTPTKIEQLRKKYDYQNANLVDIIRLFDPTKNKILTDSIMGEFIKKNQHRASNTDIMYRIEGKIPANNHKQAVKMVYGNFINMCMLDIVQELLGDEVFYNIDRFNKYWIEDKLENRDIYSYKTFDDVKNAVNKADMKEAVSDIGVRIHKIYENDEWLIMLPLSLKASQIYGAGTKWCTTQRDNTYTFWRYTQRGLLVYIINKKTNNKFAYNRLETPGIAPGDSQSEFFNAADVRVDSMDSGLPLWILNEIMVFVDKSRQVGLDTNAQYPNYDVDGYEAFLKSENENKSEAIEQPVHFRVLRNDEEVAQPMPTDEPEYPPLRA